MKKKTLKKAIIIFLILIAIFISLITFLAIKELKEEDILKQEIINFSNKDLITDTYKIEVKTTGDRAYIEETVKKYYKKLSDNIKKYTKALSNEDLINILSIENLKEDRKDYLKSHQIINNTKNIINESLNNIINLCQEDTIKELIDKDKLQDSEYYYDFYLDLMYTKKDIEKLKETKEKIKSINVYLIEYLNKIEELLKFLSIKDSVIDYTDTNIIFENQEDLNIYNKYLDELNITTTNLKEESSI